MKRKSDVAWSQRNGKDGHALFEMFSDSDLTRLPYCMVQVGDRDWALLNRDYLVLPAGKERLGEVTEVAVHTLDTDPRTWEGVWTEVGDRHLYLYDTLFDLAPDYHERLARLWARLCGCAGRA